MNTDPGETAVYEALIPGNARHYPSLYDEPNTTLTAVAIGIGIVLSVQLAVWRIHHTTKTEHSYLTQFATMLVSLVVGVYVADLLIAGPDTNLLSDNEHNKILDFIIQTCVMVFAYYFGLKAKTPEDENEAKAAKDPKEAEEHKTPAETSP